ncbi:MAG: hypothetical protein GOV01_03555 [Candidatus Altiarchaeota archaeon]|nr:hypothetical protein [Candidatus Altiarchaeota archaeon]
MEGSKSEVAVHDSPKYRGKVSVLGCSVEELFKSASERKLELTNNVSFYLLENADKSIGYCIWEIDPELSIADAYTKGTSVFIVENKTYWALKDNSSKIIDTMGSKPVIVYKNPSEKRKGIVIDIFKNNESIIDELSFTEMKIQNVLDSAFMYAISSN